MKIVGDELAILALNATDADSSDLLGRSAFNRYYYAAFLITRDTLGFMQTNWKGTAHAEIPNLLEKGLRKPAEHQIKRQVRVGLLEQSESHRVLSNLSSTARELAQLLREAYDARILADYEPEIKTSRTAQNIICLKSYKITTAKTWPAKAEAQCGQLRKIWKEIGLA